LVDGRGSHRTASSYPHLLHTEIFASVETFYRRFYFRPRKIFAIVGEMARDRQVLARRLRDGVEFLRFLAARRVGAASRAQSGPTALPCPSGSAAPPPVPWHHPGERCGGPVGWFV